MIGGTWRSRRIRFESAAAIRPTPDRVRETLFNWLQGTIPGSRCLDLFAGSGALGIEALSRGAASVTFVESDPRAARALRATLAALGAEPGAAEVVQADAFEFLGRAPRNLDVVFLDPPYAQGWLPRLCTLLAREGWLAPDAEVYLECAARDGAPALPPGWTLRRSARAGEVGAFLVRRERASGGAEAPSGVSAAPVDET